MSETPQTDAATHDLSDYGPPVPCSGGDWVAADYARKLERERDEAQKELSSIHRWIERNHADGFIDSLTYFQNLERVVDNWYDRIDAIEKDSKRFVRERDEARKDAAQLADRLSGLELRTTEELARMERERDEARAVIPEGEWVAYEDHRKVHDAASRLLVAINNQLPIGCFTLVSSEYYKLKDAIYSKEGAK